MENIQFIEWLKSELETRGWTRADLAKATKLSRATISHVLNGDRNAGQDFMIGIAQAFKMPIDHVYMAAGIFTQRTNPNLIKDEVIKYKAAELSPEQKDELINFIEFIQDRDDRRTKGNYFIEKHTRAEEKPPERAK